MIVHFLGLFQQPVSDLQSRDTFDFGGRLGRINSTGQQRGPCATESNLGGSVQGLGESEVIGHESRWVNGVPLEVGGHGGCGRIDVLTARLATSVDDVSRAFVGGVVMSEAAKQAIFVGLPGQLREQLSDADAGYVGFQGRLERAAEIAAGFGLGVEQVNVAGATAEPDVDHGASPGGGRGSGGAEPPAPQEQESCRTIEAVSEHFPAGKG